MFWFRLARIKTWRNKEKQLHWLFGRSVLCFAFAFFFFHFCSRSVTLNWISPHTCNHIQTTQFPYRQQKKIIASVTTNSIFNDQRIFKYGIVASLTTEFSIFFFSISNSPHCCVYNFIFYNVQHIRLTHIYHHHLHYIRTFNHYMHRCLHDERIQNNRPKIFHSYFIFS